MKWCGLVAGRGERRGVGSWNSNSHGTRPVHLIITMKKWTRTRRLSLKNSLPLNPFAKTLRVSAAEQAGTCPATGLDGGLRPFHQKSTCLQGTDFRVVCSANSVTSPKYSGFPKPSYPIVWNPTTELSPESEANLRPDFICID